MKPMYIALIIIGIALVAYGTQGLIAKPSQSNNSTGAMGPEDSFPSIGYFESKDPAYNFDYPKFTNWESEVSSSTIAWTPASNNSTALGKITASMREISMKVNAGYWDSKPKN